MYDHELSVAIQQERERAIREARLHHRHDLIQEPSRLARLLAIVRAGRPVPTAEGAPTTSQEGATTTHAGLTGPAGRPCAGRSTTVPG
jgi:hypothetical protein